MIYLDHAATTPTAPEVLKKMLPYFSRRFGNPSSMYRLGQEARAAIEDARSRAAKILHCRPKEVLFTGSGTEANNWAIFGVCEAYAKRGNHIITAKTEHHSVLHPFGQLERKGFRVTYLHVSKEGLVSLEEMRKAVTAETIFASVMYANNEIGTIQNIKALGWLLREKKVIFHTDACQAAGYLPLNVKNLNVDLMTINGGKIYGPKGVGALYISEKIKIMPLLFGGGQEFRMRAGTENVPGIIGMAEALAMAEAKRSSESKRLTVLRDCFIKTLLKIPGTVLNGHPARRLPNNINISIKGADGESLLMRLDMAEIAASSGSACTSGSLDPSHVLTALGLPKELVKNSLRLTLGRKTTRKEIMKAARIISRITAELQRIRS